jgi:TetR/AcrR family transcriptional regulator, mexJK operon transcriptional repressor
MPMSDQPRPAWLAPLSDERNETILSAAFDVFQEKGLHGATMLEIATKAKVSKETLYARFDSKEGLFYALLAWGSNKSGFDPDTFDHGALWDPVRALQDYAVQCLHKLMHEESIAVHRIVVGEALRMPEVARVFDEFTCQAGTVILDRIADALNEAGAARIDDKVAFGEAFMGLIRGNMHHQVTIGVIPHPSDEEIDAYALRAMTWLLRIFAP